MASQSRIADSPKKVQTLINLGNALFLPAGLLVLLSYGLHPLGLISPEVVASSFWVTIYAGFLLSLLLGIFSAFSAIASDLSAFQSGQGL